MRRAAAAPPVRAGNRRHSALSPSLPDDFPDSTMEPPPPSATQQSARHVPVLPAETLAYLAPRLGATMVDATVGLGGHAAAILERLGPAGLLIGIDRDPQALALAHARLERLAAERGWTAHRPWALRHARFAGLPDLLRLLGVAAADGLLLDLGVSSLQLDEGARGFSFRHEAPLDMRMDPGGALTAAELVNQSSEEELGRILWEFGEERQSRKIARRIVRQRPLTTTRELAELIAAAYPPGDRHGRIHPATRSFQALRIAVNEELAELRAVLERLPELLTPGGRVVVLAYHSLEDRLVKNAFEFLSGRCRCDPALPACACGARPLFRLLTRKPVTAGAAEMAANPRARSAKLRAAERL